MPKQVATDVFEILGGAAKTSTRQIADEAKKIAEEIPEQLGVKSQASADDSGQKAQPVEDKAAVAAEKAAIARYQQIQKDIEAIEEKRREEMQKRASKPVESEEKQTVKQLETTTKPPESEPKAVYRGKRKKEIFRGVSG